MNNVLEKWPMAFIHTYALQNLMHKQGQAYYSFVKRALKKGLLVQIRRGLYQIDKRMIRPFELAQELHGPSFISFESALSYHGWIPEAVYTTTSACFKRGHEIQTPLGIFSYSSVPIDCFYLGVDRVEKNTIFLIASPWRAIADLVYTQKRNWKSLRNLYEDLRIEPQEIWSSDIITLEALANNYPNRRVKQVLHYFLKNIQG